MSTTAAVLVCASIGAMIAGAVTLGIAVLIVAFGCHLVAIVGEEQP